MSAIRVIPCLDVDNGRVVKGVNFADLRDMGNPVELAENYYRESADELTFLDVTATIQGRSAMLDIVRKCASRVFIPLTVGGGIRSVEDVLAFLESGADKVSLGSAGVGRPSLISEISQDFGSQVLVISLDIKRGDSESGFIVTTHGGRTETELDAIDWIKQVEDLGAGELLVNSIDADGTRSGFDIELLKMVRSVSKLPVIASGGAGSVAHFIAAAETGVDGLLAASVFHDGTMSIAEVKFGLKEAGFEVRA